MSFSVKTMAGVLVVMAFGLLPARAGIQTWNTTTGDWSVAANWTTAVPVGGDEVVITNRGALVLLTNSTPWLSSLAISNASLSCSNWDTTIYVTNVTILSGGILTCAGPFTNTAMSNRVSVVCTNLFVETKGAINVEGKGFSGGVNLTVNYQPGHGPGAVKATGGAGHGGAGQIRNNSLWWTNTVYGSVTAPLYPGSGGGAGSSVNIVYGGHGGGAVCITADQVVVNGSINANATLPSSPNYVYIGNGDGGSGGGIYITCTTIAGTNGAITADGSECSARFTGMAFPGGGGGGRIAVVYDPAAQNAVSPVPSLRFSAAAGLGSAVGNRRGSADIGTLYFSDSYFFSPTNLFNGKWMAPGLTTFAAADLVLSNVWACLPTAALTITNTIAVLGTNYLQSKLQLTNDNVVVRGGGVTVSGSSLILGRNELFDPASLYRGLTVGPALICANDLILTNEAFFYVYAGLTNSGMPIGYGGMVSAGGDVLVATNCWILPAAHPTNGAVVLFSMRNLMLDSGGGFNANVLGYGGGRAAASDDHIKWAFGPGAVPYNGGAGYGGKGLKAYYYVGGETYGSSNAPVDPGSGASSGAGYAYSGANGGGSVQVRAVDTVRVQGAILANGGGIAGSYSPGSSGGSIYITCRTFIGDSNGVLSANGSNCAPSSASAPYDGGGGGGGRIAVWRIFDRSPTAISNYVDGGRGGYYNSFITAAPGTIVWGWIVPPSGSIVSIY